MTDSSSRHWLALARRLRLQFNAGWWLDRLNPLLIALAVVTAAAIVLLRTMGTPVATPWFWGTALALAALALAGSYAWARRRFMRPEQALVRLEDRLGLCNALTCASQGVGEWPAAPTEKSLAEAGTRPGLDAGFRWRWSSTLLPPVASAVIVGLALLVPVTPVEATRVKPSQPSGWDQLDEYVEMLEDQNIVDEKALEEMKEKIEELKSQPEEQWFSHSSLEATDSLRQALSREIQELGNELASAERGLNTLEQHSAQLSEAEREKVLGDFDKAMQGLNSGALPMNQSMKEALSKIDPSKLGQMKLDSLSQQQMQDLREAMKKGAAACQECTGGNSPGLPELTEGAGQGRGKGSGLGTGAGNGGVSPGPGTAPLTFGKENQLGTRNMEGVENLDLSRVAPGELISVGETEFELDKTTTGSQQAGSVSGLGQGGDAVWRESLVPAEREVLKKFYRNPPPSRPNVP